MCPGSLFPTNTFNPLGGFFLTFLTYAFKQFTDFQHVITGTGFMIRRLAGISPPILSALLGGLIFMLMWAATQLTGLILMGY